MTDRSHRRCINRSAGARRRREQRLQCMDDVPVSPFQKRFEQMRRGGDLNAYELARHLGYVRSDRAYPDTTRALRLLGLRDQKCSKTGRYFRREQIPYTMAVQLAELFGMDPQDAGV